MTIHVLCSFLLHNLPNGLKSFAKPEMASQNDARSYVDLFDNWIFQRNFLRWFCEAMSGFAKLLSPKGKLWIVALLLLALQLKYEMLPMSSNFTRKYVWRAPTSSAPIHNLPYGLKGLAKPDMAWQNRRKKLRRDIQLSKHSTRSHVWLR